MCAEKDPSRCHRRLLITLQLLGSGFRVIHILKDGFAADEEDFAETDSS